MNSQSLTTYTKFKTLEVPKSDVSDLLEKEAKDQWEIVCLLETTIFQYKFLLKKEILVCLASE